MIKLNLFLYSNMIKNLYIYCDNYVYRFTKEYIISINQKLKAKIIHNLNENINLENDIIIFIQKLPNIEITNKNNNIFILNTEQLTRKKWLKKILIYSKKFKIIDYSKENIDILKKNKLKNVIYFPYIYNKKEIYNFKKTKDICVISLYNMPRRRRIINSPKFKKLKIDIIEGLDKKRDEILFKYKILVNLSGSSNYNIFESIRCYRCLFNKMIVISDTKYNKNLIDYNNHILFAKIEKMPDLIKKVIDNYDYYYTKLDIDNVDIKLNNHLISKSILK